MQACYSKSLVLEFGIRKLYFICLYVWTSCYRNSSTTLFYTWSLTNHLCYSLTQPWKETILRELHNNVLQLSSLHWCPSNEFHWHIVQCSPKYLCTIAKTSLERTQCLIIGQLILGSTVYINNKSKSEGIARHFIF